MRSHFIQKKFYSRIPEDRSQLVGACHERSGSPRNVGLEIFVWTTIVPYVGMGIDEPRRHIARGGIENVCRIASRVRCARADIANPSIQHGDLHSIENLSRINIDQ